MYDAFEHWVYGQASEDVTPTQIDAQWLPFKQRFMPWETSGTGEQEAMTGWQRWNWSLFRIPLSMIAYPIAIVGVCQLAQQLQYDRPSVLDNYKRALVLGNTATLPELFRVARVTFPFTRRSVEEATQFAYQEYLKLNNG